MLRVFGIGGASLPTGTTTISPEPRLDGKPLAITQAVLANTPGRAITATLAGTSIEVVVPEPASLALVALGLAGLARRRARRS